MLGEGSISPTLKRTSFNSAIELHTIHISFLLPGTVIELYTHKVYITCITLNPSYLIELLKVLNTASITLRLSPITKDYAHVNTEKFNSNINVFTR